MGKKPAALPDNDEGYAERIVLADQHAQRALGSRLAQSPAVLDMGVKLTLQMRGGLPSGIDYQVSHLDVEGLGYLAMQVRPLTLAIETVAAPKVAEGLLRFASNEQQRTVANQLTRLRESIGKPRMYRYVQDATTGESIIPNGTTEREIADRYIYSKLVHADDARTLLDAVSEEDQLWSLAGLVGDWVAYIAHVQDLAWRIRPDLVPERTLWAGDPQTIFKRLGMTIRPFAESEVDKSPNDSTATRNND